MTRAGFRTTPVAMTHVTPGVRMPLGKQRELVDLVADDDGVPGVRAALIADDEIVLTRQQVDDLALGFVAPLQTDNTSAGHGGCSIQRLKRNGEAGAERHPKALL